MHIVELIGRIFLSALFLIEGFGKISMQENVIMYQNSSCTWYASSCLNSASFSKKVLTRKVESNKMRMRRTSKYQLDGTVATRVTCTGDRVALVITRLTQN